MAKGWICIHRQLQECEIWTKDQQFDMRSAWIDLLLFANHEDKQIVFDYKPMTIKRGQYLTSVRKLSERWKWDKERTLKYLRLLERLGMITKDSNNRRTLLTIENYEKYQGWQDAEPNTTPNSNPNAERTLNEHYPATNNNVNNDNNENNKKNRAFKKPTLEQVREYCQERNNTINPEQFIDYYESNGWMVGKNKMKDWKAAVRTWENNRKGGNSNEQSERRTERDNRTDAEREAEIRAIIEYSESEEGKREDAELWEGFWDNINTDV